MHIYEGCPVHTGSVENHELKNDSGPSEKSERINRRDWYNHFYKLLHNDTNEVGDEIKTSIKK